MGLDSQIVNMAKTARAASYKMAIVSQEAKNRALRLMAKALIGESRYLLSENRKDLAAAAAKKGYSKALLDRLSLNAGRIENMAKCLLETAALKDPVGEVLKSLKRPNGLTIKKVRTPIGVVGIIFEARPNVTSDCIGLCLKSGNAVILKGGREAIRSNTAIVKILKSVAQKAGVPADGIQLVSSTDHKAVDILLAQEKYIDLVIPRGGEQLIRLVVEKSRIPVIKHYKGICHVYVSDKADMAMARKICFNAKVQRPGVCNAMETMLVHQNAAKRFLPMMIDDFKKAGVEIRGCPLTRRVVKGIKAANAQDWDEEYLDLILSVKVVRDTNDAIEHINAHSSHHSDAIVTKDVREADSFLKRVDSACLFVNTSTRFSDGYQFGMGAEIGISTDKLHARGPMGLEELTTYKYLVYGKGQLRQ
ncbi:MAG TPA: glutamate-5-semialdehyde dehydrogenase [Candidatus Omnitrophota bacterium]|nr:glutamate-5-semialdehyde dehydrogenase [Candidatus Omnitrophota bacterium]HPD83986.1 glutamate-5-semialdehyde dehydrogenase [Candidatus Omnitrophota bacterium]HRZ02843.1 glutamate-5-semialdehyde dehydrogenase [Candidatus Omnitrophota bacterium]